MYLKDEIRIQRRTLGIAMFSIGVAGLVGLWLILGAFWHWGLLSHWDTLWAVGWDRYGRQKRAPSLYWLFVFIWWISTFVGLIAGAFRVVEPLREKPSEPRK